MSILQDITIMGVGSGRPCLSLLLDFHTWYKYSR